MTKTWPKRLPVVNSRYSETGSGVPLCELDFSQWWTDFGLGGTLHYLHVPHREDGSVQRVHCKRCDRPRLMMREGVLYWLVDRKPKKFEITP